MTVIITERRLDDLRRTPRSASVTDVEDLVSEVDRLRQQVHEWLTANAPGGWIDGFRQALARIEAKTKWCCQQYADSAYYIARAALSGKSPNA